MKLTVVASATVLSLIPMATTLAAIAFLAPSPAAAQTSAYAQSDCVRQTMYDYFGNIRPGMNAEAAAFACRSAKRNNDVSNCVQQTMYDYFGNIRPGMTAEAAAFACGSAKFNSGVSECVQQTLYDNFGNIRPGMTAEAAAFACSDNNDVSIPVIILKP